jgi:hypothetical protein
LQGDGWRRNNDVGSTSNRELRSTRKALWRDHSKSCRRLIRAPVTKTVLLFFHVVFAIWHIPMTFMVINWRHNLLLESQLHKTPQYRYNIPSQWHYRHRIPKPMTLKIPLQQTLLHYRHLRIAKTCYATDITVLHTNLHYRYHNIDRHLTLRLSGLPTYHHTWANLKREMRNKI